MTAIEDKYNILLGNGLNLGATVGGEDSLYDGGTRQVYEFGSIYFHPRHEEAFECHGLILQTYVDMFAEQSGLGYPISDEMDNPSVVGGRMNSFEFGPITWDPTNGINTELNADLEALPQVIVKVLDTFPINLTQDNTMSLEQLINSFGLPGGEVVTIIAGLVGDLVFGRLLSSVSSEEVQDLINQAQIQDASYSPPNFDNFLVIDCPDGFDTDSLANALSQWVDVIEYAYTASVAVDPVVGAGNPLFSQQGYLDGISGINVQAAWQRGADGTGTRFIDLEQGWFLAHEDLPKGIPLLDGINKKASFSHGAAVLGEIIATDDNRGVVGISPQANCRVISYHHPKEPFNSAKSRARVASTIVKASHALSFGDVLLLEVQLKGKINGIAVFVPVETDQAIFEVIRLATKAGVIVVEPAGNLSANLDDFINASGKKVLSRTVSSEFKDSGAIMVAGCRSIFPHSRWVEPTPPGGSNFGSRIDCYAWGENVVTTGNEAQPTLVNGYWTAPVFFRGTSAAAPIIVGACLLIQHLQILLRSRSGIVGKLNPFQMRQLLSNPQNGTPSFLVTDQIGVMPDFQKILINEYF